MRPGKLGVEDRGPVEDANNENEEANTIPYLGWIELGALVCERAIIER